MRTIRQLMCWFFAFNAVIPALMIVAMLFPNWQARYNWHGESRLVGLLCYFLFLSPFVIVFGMAWWTVFMVRKWARAWATTASVIVLFMFSVLLIKHSPLGFGYTTFLGIAGILGLISFARRSTVFDFDEPGED